MINLYQSNYQTASLASCVRIVIDYTTLLVLAHPTSTLRVKSFAKPDIASEIDARSSLFASISGWIDATSCVDFAKSSVASQSS